MKPKPQQKGKSRKNKQEVEETFSEGHLSAKNRLLVCPFKWAEIAKMLQASKTLGVDQALAETLASFLLEPVAVQFWQVLQECEIRSHSKTSAKDNAAYEKEAEQIFQSLKFTLKQMDTIRLVQGVSQEQYQSIVGPVKAYLAKTAAASLLNRLLMI